MAGMSLAADTLQILDRHLADQYDVYETTGDPSENITEVTRDALARGYDTIVAVGGDGTVSEVAAALVGTDVPMGVVPGGTANVFAQELGIPLDVDAACALIVGEHSTMRVDAMEVDGRCFVLQIGIGLDSLMIRDTDRRAKRRFGRLAYVWTFFTRLVGFQPVRFTIAADDRRLRPRASQVLVANGGVLGAAPFRWGDHIRPDDGRIDICIISARSGVDYARLAWHALLGRQRQDRSVRFLTAERTIVVSTDRPLPIQADGEIIGDTPLQIRVVPSALHIVVPLATPDATDRGSAGGGDEAPDVVLG
jgi:YegS/Rv2252/BmrU family lipid kinase